MKLASGNMNWLGWPEIAVRNGSAVRKGSQLGELGACCFSLFDAFRVCGMVIPASRVTGFDSFNGLASANSWTVGVKGTIGSPVRVCRLAAPLLDRKPNEETGRQ